MTTSLFVEEQANGIAFYINGELQFHSADEAIYHEYLAIPAIALAAKRFPNQSLRVLICGGGDGLAARDTLRFSQVRHIDLVDYSQEVIDLANSSFATFNQNSLTNPKVNVHVHEAFAFLSNKINQLAQNQLAQNKQDEPNQAFNHKYHTIICDFTYPISIEETQVYSQEWFALLQQVLIPSGTIAINAVSPNHNTLAFWCIFKSIQANGLDVKPMQLMIPSFVNHDYGSWGFLLASEQIITEVDMESLVLPEDLSALNLADLRQVFVLDQAIAKAKDLVISHHNDSSQLFFYLLNHRNLAIPNLEITPQASEHLAKVDFLNPAPQSNSNSQEITLTTNPLSLFTNSDPMSLDNLAKAWLKQLETNPDDLLIPAQHYSQTSGVSKEWIGRVKDLLGQINLPRLIAKILERSQELPQEIAEDLRELQSKLLNFQSLSQQQNRFSHNSNNSYDYESNLTNLSDRHSFNLTTAKVIAILSITLLVANLAAPDAVFAKGSTTSYGSASSGDGSGGLSVLGVMMMIGGIYWLINIANDESK